MVNICPNDHQTWTHWQGDELLTIIIEKTTGSSHTHTLEECVIGGNGGRPGRTSMTFAH